MLLSLTIFSEYLIYLFYIIFIVMAEIHQECRGGTLFLFQLVCVLLHFKFYTLSGHIGKVDASHAAVARSIPAEDALIYNIHEALRRYCP